MAGRKARRGGGRATIPRKASGLVTQTIFTSETPTTPNGDDGQALTVGTRFTPDIDGTITGVRVYRATTAPTTLIALLYNSGGTELARTTISSPTTGWNTGTFTTPVNVSAATIYVAAYFSNGPYAYSASVLPITNSHLTTNGARWIYGASATYPSNTAGVSTAAYFADPIFSYDPATAPPPPAVWPDATNTGVPAGTTLTAYSGPMTITTPNTVIDGKNITGTLSIQTTGVIVQNCYIFGGIYTDENVSGRSFTVQDCEINVGGVHGENAQDGTGIASRDFVARRCHIYGGRRSINCWINGYVEDCYVHGQADDPSGVEHESGIRMGANSTILHNTIICDAPDFPPDAGCSAAMTGYGDFAVVENNLIQNNFFGATTGGYCAYGGSTLGKPFSAGTNNIRFIGNVFEKGRLNDHGQMDCGYYGAITAFDTGAPGNVWTNNRYSDGTVLNP